MCLHWNGKHCIANGCLPLRLCSPTMRVLPKVDQSGGGGGIRTDKQWIMVQLNKARAQPSLANEWWTRHWTPTTHPSMHRARYTNEWMLIKQGQESAPPSMADIRTGPQWWSSNDGNAIRRGQSSSGGGGGEGGGSCEPRPNNKCFEFSATTTTAAVRLLVRLSYISQAYVHGPSVLSSLFLDWIVRCFSYTLAQLFVSRPLNIYRARSAWIIVSLLLGSGPDVGIEEARHSGQGNRYTLALSFSSSSLPSIISMLHSKMLASLWDQLKSLQILHSQIESFSPDLFLACFSNLTEGVLARTIQGNGS